MCVWDSVSREGLIANGIRFSGQVLIAMGATPHPRSYSPTCHQVLKASAIYVHTN